VKKLLSSTLKTKDDYYTILSYIMSIERDEKTLNDPVKRALYRHKYLLLIFYAAKYNCLTTNILRKIIQVHTDIFGKSKAGVMEHLKPLIEARIISVYVINKKKAQFCLTRTAKKILDEILYDRDDLSKTIEVLKTLTEIAEDPKQWSEFLKTLNELKSKRASSQSSD